MQKTREQRVLNALLNGSSPKLRPSHPRVSRENELAAIMNKVTPSVTDKYELITGQHGTGKTTLVIEACQRGMQLLPCIGVKLCVVGGGCVYVAVPNKEAGFVAELAKAINFQFDDHISVTNALHHKLFGTTMQGLRLNNIAN